MIEIYILAKPEELERINEEVKKYQDIANVKVITDINEIPLDTIPDEQFRDIVERYYDFHETIKLPDIEEFVKENKTEFQKLSSFDRKEKNQARKKLERQALNYQNRHYKK